MQYLRAIGVGGHTDAAPIQKRIRHLVDERGITYDTIEERTGVDNETLKTHYRGSRWPHEQPVTVCTKRVERLILKARFGPSDGYRFPAVGVRRRLQALQAGGFTLAVISDIIGKDLRQVHAVMCGKTNKLFITREFAEKIIEGFGKLECEDPSNWGVEPRLQKYSKTRAGKNGYAPAHCWDPDTIDDPDAIPEWTGACGTTLGRSIHKRERIPMCVPCRDATENVSGAFSPTKFRALREASGYSQKRLEKATGLAEGAISWWERGRSVPRDRNLDKVLTVLNAGLDEVIED